MFLKQGEKRKFVEVVIIGDKKIMVAKFLSRMLNGL